MSAEVVNLRRARKVKSRAGKAAAGAAKRAVHGRTKVARALEALDRTRAERGLDGHRLERAREGSDDDGDADES